MVPFNKSLQPSKTSRDRSPVSSPNSCYRWAHSTLPNLLLLTFVLKSACSLSSTPLSSCAEASILSAELNDVSTVNVSSCWRGRKWCCWTNRLTGPLEHSPNPCWPGEIRPGLLLSHLNLYFWEVEFFSFPPHLCVDHIYWRHARARYACNPGRNPAMTNSTAAAEAWWGHKRIP